MRRATCWPLAVGPIRLPNQLTWILRTDLVGRSQVSWISETDLVGRSQLTWISETDVVRRSQVSWISETDVVRRSQVTWLRSAADAVRDASGSALEVREFCPARNWRAAAERWSQI